MPRGPFPFAGLAGSATRSAMSVPDSRFFATRSPMTIAEACAAAGAVTLDEGGGGEGTSVRVTHADALATAREGAVAFADASGPLAGAGAPTLLLTTNALAERAGQACPGAVIAVADHPKAAFAALAGTLHASRIEAEAPLAGIAQSARLAASAQVAPSAVVGEAAMIHADAVLGPHAVIGPGVVIGPGTIVGPHVTVTHAVIDAGCRLSAGVRVGEAGFGYAAGPEGAVPVPQLGRVLIGQGVELGANACVDRGALSDTVIGRGTKIDNLCQIAHGCRIGAHVLIASQTGLSGGVRIGDGAMIGGQVGMAEHIEIGAGAAITAQAGLMRDVPPGERWGGSPARPARQWLKETAALARLAAKRDR